MTKKDKLPNRSVEISKEVNECFEHLYHDLSEGDENNVILAHFGEFTQDLVNTISEGVEGKLYDIGTKKSVIKKMFSILIEGLQNIRIHGEKYNNDSQHGHVIVADAEDKFVVSFGNYVKNSEKNRLIENLNKLNELSTIEVKQLYMEVLGNGIISEKGGAGLGFITIAMKSKSKLEYNFKEINKDLSYFYVNVDLNY